MGNAQQGSLLPHLPALVSVAIPPHKFMEAFNSLFVLSHFFDKIRGYDITLETDNTAAQQSLSNLCTRNGALRSVACKVVMLITAADAKLTTRQVPGETLLSKGGRSLTLLYRNQLRQAHSGSEGYRSQCLPSP